MTIYLSSSYQGANNAWASELTHEASRVGLICPNLSINKNMSLHKNGLDLTVCQCILELVSEDKNQGQALPWLVWPGWWLGGLVREENYTNKNQDSRIQFIQFQTSFFQQSFTYKRSTKFVKHPMLWGIEPLQMLLQSSCLLNTTNTK